MLTTEYCKKLAKESKINVDHKNRGQFTNLGIVSRPGPHRILIQSLRQFTLAHKNLRFYKKNVTL